MQRTRILNISRWSFCLWLFAILLTPSLFAQQMENEEVVCSESNEPLALKYGDHTAECIIDPATDLDQFNFEGVAGDSIRITVLSSVTDGLDPRLELRDPEGTTVIDGSCLDNSSGHTCSFQEDLFLTISGTYSLAVSDSGTDEPGSYFFSARKNSTDFEPSCNSL